MAGWLVLLVCIGWLAIKDEIVYLSALLRILYLLVGYSIYVYIHFLSMEPRFHAFDLSVLLTSYLFA